jgi:hypothetical protein
VRRTYLALIGVAIVLFLLVSGVLARVFSADGAERSAILSLLQTEARGDQNGMLDRIDGCRASAECRARVAHTAAALKHAGSISILTETSSAGFSLTGTTGVARVAWIAGSSLPNVQCVKVRRAGDAVSGLRIELLAITPKLPGASNCPARFY